MEQVQWLIGSNGYGPLVRARACSYGCCSGAVRSQTAAKIWLNFSAARQSYLGRLNMFSIYIQFSTWFLVCHLKMGLVDVDVLLRVMKHLSIRGNI
jgi:hypothetical protein